MSTDTDQKTGLQESESARNNAVAPTDAAPLQVLADDELVDVNDRGSGLIGWLFSGPAVRISKDKLYRTSAQPLEEYKELGNEYRYRESIVVTQFQLAIFVSATIGYNARWTPTAHLWEYLPLRFVGATFLTLIALHLRNLNHDRLATRARRTHLANQVSLFENHMGKALRRLSAPALMQRFIALLATLWWAWAIYRIPT